MKRFLCYVLSFVLIISSLTFVPLTTFASDGDFAGGNGTAESPYLISSKQQLANVAEHLDAHFKLICDIDYESSVLSPLGSRTESFRGVFDGNGYAIKNAEINEGYISTVAYAGLFAHNLGVIKNLDIIGGEVSALTTETYAYAGAFAAINDGIIINCNNIDSSVTAEDSGEYSYAGGIAGFNAGEITDCSNTGYVSAEQCGGITTTNDGIIKGCHNSGTISEKTGDRGSAGGIATLNNREISNCYNTGNVTEGSYYDAYAGGIATSNTGNILLCYNTGAIYAYSSCSWDFAATGGDVSFAGGIAATSSGTIEVCYNTGKIDGSGGYATIYAGGIAGYGNVIKNCYNTGEVSTFKGGYGMGGERLGGIAGIGGATNCYNAGEVYPEVEISLDSLQIGGIVGGGSVTNCYYIDRIDVGIGGGKDGAVCCTKEQLMNQDTFKGFDFDEIWTMNPAENQYPVLKFSHIHSFDSLCDSDCNECGFVRTPVHVFDNGCDKECNDCGFARQTKDHKYTNECDTDCNECGLKRKTEHKYYKAPNFDVECRYCKEKSKIATEVTGNYTLKITGCDPTVTELEIPEKIVIGSMSYTVTAIAASAFEKSPSLTKVTIGDGVVSIGMNAFKNCDALETVIMSDSVVSLGSAAFYSCNNLKNITLSNKINEIHEGTFGSCTSLERIDLPSSITYIGKKAFSYCTGLKEITIPDSVKTIGSYVFESCESLLSVTIGNSVVSVGDYSFWQCISLRTVTLPKSLKTLNGVSFLDCNSLKDVNYEGTEEDKKANLGYLLQNKDWHFGISYSCEHLFEDDCDAVCNKCGIIRIAPHVLDGESDAACNECGEAIFLEFIYNETDLTATVSNCDIYVKEVVIPETVKKDGKEYIVNVIQSGVFENCKKLTRVVIPDTVTVIGTYAFLDCKKLTDVNIPDSVTVIKRGVFSGCSALEKIDLPSGITIISDEAFENCSSLKEINIPATVTAIGQKVFKNCKSLSKLEIPYGVETVGYEAFKDCIALTEIELPDSVTQMDDSVFYNCISLKKAVLSDSITVIGSSAFMNCPLLETIEFPKGLVEIEGNAFNGCTGFVNFAIPQTVKTIGISAFRLCKNLKTVIIGSSVIDIKKWAFDECLNLTDVYYEGSQAQKQEIAIASDNPELLNALWHYNQRIDRGHVFDDYCEDTLCNACGFNRESFAHFFDSDCDIKCNFCDYSRHTEAEHIYKSDCEKFCSKCNFERVPKDHIYDDVCDVSCNVCGYQRVAPHSYSEKNNLTHHWKVCLLCRTVFDKEEHLFTHDFDPTCENCDYNRKVSKPEIYAVSMTLDKSLEYNVKILGNVDGINAAVEFTLCGKTYGVKNYTFENGYSVFTLRGIGPQYMTEKITAEFTYVTDGKKQSGGSYETTLADYCISICQTDDGYKPLVNAILNYGAAAQIYKNYKTETLSNASLTDSEKQIADMDYHNAIDKEYFAVNSPTADWKTHSLILEDTVKAKFVIETDEDTDNLSVLVETEFMDEVATFTDCFEPYGDKYIFCFDEYFARDMSDVYLFTICKDGKPISNTISYSVESYAAATDSTDDEPLKNLMKALMNYSAVAKQY